MLWSQVCVCSAHAVVAVAWGASHPESLSSSTCPERSCASCSASRVSSVRSMGGWPSPLTDRSGHHYARMSRAIGLSDL
jgi:hypothetical protein